jgi:hypothetical protein
MARRCCTAPTNPSRVFNCGAHFVDDARNSLNSDDDGDDEANRLLIAPSAA